MRVQPRDGFLVSAEDNGFPYCHPGCHTCGHPRRDYIELLLRARVSSRAIRKKLIDLGIWAPTFQSIANHRKRHMIPARLLDQIAAAEHDIRIGMTR